MISSVSGRGIRTDGLTSEIAAPELLHAADVGDRLAAGAALDQRVEALDEMPASASSVVVRQSVARSQPRTWRASRSASRPASPLSMPAAARRARAASIFSRSVHFGCRVTSRSFSAV